MANLKQFALNTEPTGNSSPGPWKMKMADDGQGAWALAVLDAAGGIVHVEAHDDRHDDRPVEVVIADGLLISASPDLLAVVEALLTYFPDLPNMLPRELRLSVVKLMADAAWAVQKAKEGQQ